ncbi:uncharacterized protein DS421_1g16370 [Arachis hypogaea]|nr:uncharacterized protein DS421_1g16370 [Arachis hypogaea]
MGRRKRTGRGRPVVAATSAAMLSSRQQAMKRWQSSGIQRKRGKNGHGDSHKNGCNHADTGVEKGRTSHLKRENDAGKL